MELQCSIVPFDVVKGGLEGLGQWWVELAWTSMAERDERLEKEQTAKQAVCAALG